MGWDDISGCMTGVASGQTITEGVAVRQTIDVKMGGVSGTDGGEFV